jgi:hypothetical protein
MLLLCQSFIIKNQRREDASISLGENEIEASSSLSLSKLKLVAKIDNFALYERIYDQMIGKFGSYIYEGIPFLK